MKNHDAIRNVLTNVVTIVGNLCYDKDGNKISISDLEKKLIEQENKRLSKEYKQQQYKRDRAIKYLPLAEQLDMIYWDKINGTNLWQEHITDVKNSIPKA